MITLRCDMLNRGTKEKPGRRCKRAVVVSSDGYNISTWLNLERAVCCATHAKILQRGDLVEDRQHRRWHWSQSTQAYTCSLSTTPRLTNK